MNCKFCNQPCQKSHNTYYLCQSCKVFFHESKRETIFRPNSPTYWYWLKIDLDEDRTTVEYERDPSSMSDEERMDLDPMSFMPKKIVDIQPAMQGVTPQNMRDKLKTLLVFS